MWTWIRHLFGGGEGFPLPPSHLDIPTMESCALTPKELKEKMDRGDPVVLVDVREAFELEQAAIPGVRHIPMGEIHMRYKEISSDPNAEVVVFSHHGSRSEQVMTQLWGLGYQNTKNLAGGIQAWSEEVDLSIPQY